MLIMEIKSIVTKRKFESWPSYHIVYEWEDNFIENMAISLKFEKNNLIYKVLRKIKIKQMSYTNKKTLVFEISARLNSNLYNSKNVVPVIIDFHISLEELNAFNSTYKKNPLVLISNLEVVNFLKENKSPIHYQHFPLSLPDKYKILEDAKMEKKWDLVLVGRQNPVLMEWLLEFEKKHPDFVYVYRELIDKKFNYYTNKGEFIGNIDDRSGYMSLIQQSKIGFYSTPGIDGGEKRTKGFNQVTPRFLELIACCCHVIARYPKNADTDYYELNKFCESVESYEQFEIQMENALTTQVPLDKYTKYMENHYTSERVKLLQEILRNN